MTKFGQCMYKMCLNFSIDHLVKYKCVKDNSGNIIDTYKVPNVWYYLLNFTWGLIPTILGGIPWFFAWMCCGFKSKKFYGRRYLVVGKDWGGVELGINFIVSDGSGNRTKSHELGHTYQNAILGVFVIFLGWIPSASRYWYRELKYYRRGLTPKTDYDAFWYEKCATDTGRKIIG